MKILLMALMLFSCSSDVHIMKKEDPLLTESDAPVQDTATTPPNQNEDTAEVSNMTDLTIGFGQIYFRQIACPACVGETSEFDITAELKLHYPTSGNYYDWITPIGDCTTNPFETHVSSEPLLTTQPAYFNSISLNPAGAGLWRNTVIYEHQYERNTKYTITTEHATIIDAFQTVEGFDSIEPYTLLWIDPSYAFDAIISKSGTYFNWTPIVTGSQFEITIAVYTPDGSQFLGSISCMELDNGSMFIPGIYFQTFPEWSLAAVYLTRHKFNRIPVQSLNGHFESHMRWEVVGTAHIE